MEQEEKEKGKIKEMLREGIDECPSEIENFKMSESLPKFQIKEELKASELQTERDEFDEPSFQHEHSVR